MGRYIVRRVISGVVTLFVLLVVTFFLMHIVPGSPFAQHEDKMPAEIRAQVEAKYGLDKPLMEQFITYLGNTLRGDFGISFIKPSTNVNEILDLGFPISARVGAIVVVVSLFIGVGVGILSAIRRGSLLDSAVMVFATVGVSVPLFVISVLLLYLFAGVWNVLPTYGLTTWRHYILPVACLSFSPIAYIARLTRSSMLEVIEQDYIRTARAKGVKESMVILRHALRNAILPVVTYLGPLVASLLTGSFIVERLFAIPGMGRYYVESIGSRDYNVILGMTVFFGIFVVACNLLVDILYGIIDPRVKMDE
ncbi:MAG TPA: ABC transporter permease [Candidatus Excrementavichristensenella intestinipullorum]|nr:ABC transporter permease [Candidatus Excrementavichristensenella intestinipullorum]